MAILRINKKIFLQFTNHINNHLIGVKVLPTKIYTNFALILFTVLIQKRITVIEYK
jgi:hypothetical protein